jgi:RNA polymerase sigma-70 factor (ECF subfamily)
MTCGENRVRRGGFLAVLELLQVTASRFADRVPASSLLAALRVERSAVIISGPEPDPRNARHWHRSWAMDMVDVLSPRKADGRVMSDHPDEPRPESVATPLGERSDRSLLRRLRRGEDDAATALYLRYAHRLLALTRTQASAELARQTQPEDIVQSVFLSFFRKAAGGMYDVPEGEELWNLLLVITLNKIRAKGNYFRARKRDARRNLGPEIPEGDSAAAAPDEAAFAELQAVIHDLLADLPAKSAEIVEMRIAGNEVAEIARKSKRSLRTVERTLQDFRSQLSAMLQEES